jgi:hypothetical protein
MSKGWIKLHRNLIDWEWYDDINARVLLIHLLLSVNYEDKKWKGNLVEKGTMVLSWSTLSSGCGLSVKKCRTAMSKLEDSGEVTRLATSKFQVVRLVKWDKLQQIDDAEGKPVDKQTDKLRADKGQAEGRQRATTKETNKLKNIRSKETKNILLSEVKTSDLVDLEITYFEIAKAFKELFIKNISENGGSNQNQKNAKYKNYTDPIRLMMEKDGVTRDQIIKVWKFLGSQEGDFWKSNILSTQKLREKFSQLIIKANQNENRDNSKKFGNQSSVKGTFSIIDSLVSD